MKRLLVCKCKTTFQLLGEEHFADCSIEAGEQLIEADTICINEIDSSSMREEIKAWLTPKEIDKNRVFQYMNSCLQKCKQSNVMMTLAVEENRIYKQFGNTSEKKEKYYTVTYNLFSESSGKSFANEFLVFDELDQDAENSLFAKVMDEIAWNNMQLVEYEKNQKQWIFSAQAAGFFFHECIGHLLEEEQFVLSDYRVGDVLFQSPISIIENYETTLERDDCGADVVSNLPIVERGKIINIITAYQMPYSGNAYTQEAYAEPLARMNAMYVKASKTEDNIVSNVAEGVFIREISSGEYNPINGEIGLVISKANKIKNGILCECYQQINLLFNIKDLLGADISLSNNYCMVNSLCGKIGTTKKITYHVPEMKIDWRKNGKCIEDRYF